MTEDMSTTRILHIDMDNVLVNFQSGLDRVGEDVKAEYGEGEYDNIPGLFDKMDSLAGEADDVAVRLKALLSDEMVSDVQGAAGGARRLLDQNVELGPIDMPKLSGRRVGLFRQVGLEERLAQRVVVREDARLLVAEPDDDGAGQRREVDHAGRGEALLRVP